MLRLAKRLVAKSLERDRAREPYVERASRFLWPWGEVRLLAVVPLLAMLDFTSTYAALELSKKPDIYETGPLASWALRTGGFGGLLLCNIVAVASLSLAAVTARSLCSRFGFSGFGRTYFVLLLLPYAAAVGIAIINNLVLTFL